MTTVPPSRATQPTELALPDRQASRRARMSRRWAVRILRWVGRELAPAAQRTPPAGTRLTRGERAGNGLMRVALVMLELATGACVPRAMEPGMHDLPRPAGKASAAVPAEAAGGLRPARSLIL